jgi:hypothetical protein
MRNKDERINMRIKLEKMEGKQKQEHGVSLLVKENHLILKM